MYCIAGSPFYQNTKQTLSDIFCTRNSFHNRRKIVPFLLIFLAQLWSYISSWKANPTCSKISERWKTTDCLTAERQNIFHEKTKDKCQSESFRLNKKGLRRVTDSSPITNFIFAICRYLLFNDFSDVLSEMYEEKMTQYL